MGDSSFHRLLSPLESKQLIKSAIKHGIMSFDSAFSYKSADNYLYSALNEINVKREDVRLISKVMPIPTLEKKAYISLNRLKTSYFDVLLLHWPTEEKALYSSLSSLEKLQGKGISKEIGVSNFNLSLLKKVIKDFNITVHERPLSLIWNKDYEEESELGLKTYGYAPLAMGTLTNNPIESFTDSRSNLYIFKSGYKEYLTLKNCLIKLSKDYNCTISDIAYGWVERTNPYAIVFGASKIEHLKTFAKPLPINDEDYKQLTELATNLNRKAPMDNIFSHEYLHH